MMPEVVDTVLLFEGDSDDGGISIGLVSGERSLMNVLDQLLDLHHINHGTYLEIKRRLRTLLKQRLSSYPVHDGERIIDLRTRGGDERKTEEWSESQASDDESETGESSLGSITNHDPTTSIKQGGGRDLSKMAIDPARARKRLYEFKCSCSHPDHVGSEWMAVVSSEMEPTKNLALQKAPSSTASPGGDVFLALDDSVSMRKNYFGRGGDPIGDLKKATKGFLDRVKETHRVEIHCFNDNSVQILGHIGPEHHSFIEELTTRGDTPMKRCLQSVATSIDANASHEGSVVILFSDGSPSDGDPLPVADLIKNRGVRMITVGCGIKGKTTQLMLDMASTADDFHQATDSSELLGTFRTIAKALAQSNASLPTAGGSAKGESGSICEQVMSRAGGPLVSQTSSSTGSQFGALDPDEGFDAVQNFECHFCNSDLRVVCPYCRGMSCGGAVDTSTGEFGCPACAGMAVVEQTGTLRVHSEGTAMTKGGK
jgi:uncharacterized protein YegL